MITNPKRKRQITEFRDSDHEVMGFYYELLDERELNADTAREMLKLIKIDPDYYDPYLVVSEYFYNEGQDKKARILAEEAYKRAVVRIVDYKGRFPKDISWLCMENRHIIRAIGNWGRILWSEGKNDEALDIFRRIFRSNPNDNTGCRFDVLAILLGHSPDFLEKKFSTGKGLIDAFKVDKWFNKYSKKFPEEFTVWYDILEKQETGDEDDKWEYFDDCAICQEMKKAEKEGRSLTSQELRLAFTKVNKKKVKRKDPH